MSEPLVEVRDVSHRFANHAALTGIALKIDAGSYTVLLGPSGSGKTTLLSILGGFVVPSQGKVFIARRGLHSIAARETPDHDGLSGLCAVSAYDGRQ